MVLMPVLLFVFVRGSCRCRVVSCCVAELVLLLFVVGVVQFFCFIFALSFECRAYFK